ncbi:hypothetical protein SUGI_0634730 [Cryptomeria japonica]|uniref:calcium-binding protein CP1 n=1 Tax=Cryptomeria japonica TaxID=3369 RepID=UPI002414A70A|nr:calcium-binding protein CP1 [Cryptomeria japonica]GLJ31619.1 hypothetical protein SUGI_0634730 [Cryptomeria japonica]
MSSSSSSSSSQNRLFLHPSSISHLRQAFTILDRDKDGKIASSDLHEFFNNLPINHVSEEDVESMMRAADLDHKGYVQFQEFERIITSFMEEEAKNSRKGDRGGFVKFPEKSPLEEIFEVIDRDGDGIISLGDLREFMGVVMQEADLNPTQLIEMMKAAGGSHNSGITKQDFVAMMTAKVLKV